MWEQQAQLAAAAYARSTRVYAMMSAVERLRNLLHGRRHEVLVSLLQQHLGTQVEGTLSEPSARVRYMCAPMQFCTMQRTRTSLSCISELECVCNRGRNSEQSWWSPVSVLPTTVVITNQKKRTDGPNDMKQARQGDYLVSRVLLLKPAWHEANAACLRRNCHLPARTLTFQRSQQQAKWPSAASPCSPAAPLCACR